jgi:hypothetical protein
MGSAEIQGRFGSRRSGRRTFWLLLSCIGAGSAGGCFSLPKIDVTQTVIQCSVTRQDCLAEEIGDGGGVSCAQRSSSEDPPFTATICGFVHQVDGSVSDPNTECTQQFCTQPAGVAYGYPSGCTATGTDVTAQLPPAGVCHATASSKNLRLSHITYSQTWHDCNEAPGGAFCATLPPNQFSGDGCFAVDSSPAIFSLVGPNSRRDPTLLISAYVANAPDCPFYGNDPTGTAFALTAGTIGTATGGGVTAPLTLVSGFATGRQVCGSSGCTTTVNRLQANLADQVVSGFQVSNLLVNSVQPIAVSGVADPDSGLVSVPAGAVNLVATARVNGSLGVFVLANHAPFQARVTTTALTLKGPLDMVVTDANGRPLPITMPISVTGTLANAQAQGCVGMTSVDRLFGFENPLDWNATNAKLSLVTSPITQGCGALGVAGQGYMPITSAPFPTPPQGLQSALSVDLFIPGNQPNPSWLGALQAYLTCPSANFVNQYIGQVDLTGKPQNKFSTLRFPLPAPIVTTLGPMPVG